MSGILGFNEGFSNSLSSDGFGSGFEIPGQRVVTSGLVMHFDVAAGSYPGSGTTLTDLSGNGYNATLFNSPTYSTSDSGVLRYAKSSYQYATAPNPGDINRWTLETWVKFNEATVAGTNAIITGQYDLVSKLNFVLGTADSLSNTIKTGYFNGAWRYTSSGQAVSIGSWYHFVGTYDGSTISLYTNNSLTSTLSYSGTAASGGEVRIARRWDSVNNDSNNFISADIPVVRIYNRALDTTEISNNYNAHRNRYGL